MKITFLGHAGFCVETDEAVVIMDPWVSAMGAFDAAWFQLPRNHHLASFVEARLSDPGKSRFLYVSHEHADHFDPAFLLGLSCRDFTVVVPDFRRPVLRKFFSDYGCREVLACGDGDEVAIPGGSLRLYVDDSELNKDSAILVRAHEQTFLNLNDCRIVDALPSIRRDHGRPDVFTCQYSGAGWHPTCYQYPRDRYEAIARKKVLSKFRGVVQAIRALEPRLYLPSAGPPCFLDPALVHLNFERVNIFPRARQLLDHLDATLTDVDTVWAEVMPGDVVDAGEHAVVAQGTERVDDRTHAAYIRGYARDYEEVFARRARQSAAVDAKAVLRQLRDALREKVAHMSSRDRVLVPLYVGFRDVEGCLLRVDLSAGTVEEVDERCDPTFYSYMAPVGDVARVLEGAISWDELSLSFRVALDRDPDVYTTLVQGFLRLEAEDLDAFCARLLSIEERQERIVVEASGRRYEVDRYCPHQGGDLGRGWIEEGRCLVCPRHQWQFDLADGGAARANDGSIRSVCLDDG